jgi:hypothetical protein
MPIASYLDASVLIAALTGKGPTAVKAYDVVNDPNRRFVYSDYLRLEVICKPTFNRRTESLEVYEEFFSSAKRTPNNDKVVERAVDLGCVHDIEPLDALHISASVSGKAEEFITAEKPSKPLFRATGLGPKLISIYTPDVGES